MTSLLIAGAVLASLFGHGDRLAPRRPPLQYAYASWYSDANGRCASPAGCSYYGVANRTLPFGTKVTFYWRGRSVRATVDDRGPFIYSRLWDLNEHVAAALDAFGVERLGWR